MEGNTSRVSGENNSFSKQADIETLLLFYTRYGSFAYIVQAFFCFLRQLFAIVAFLLHGDGACMWVGDANFDSIYDKLIWAARARVG